jgi:predicted transcriptional regulator
MYISILEALAYNGPSKITRITYTAKMNFGQLKPIIDDLIKKNLVKEKMFKKKIAYLATPRARTVLFYFNELKEMLPTTED